MLAITQKYFLLAFYSDDFTLADFTVSHIHNLLLGIANLVTNSIANFILFVFFILLWMFG